MYGKMQLRALFCSIAFCTAAMVSMLVFFERKAIVIADVAQDQVEGSKSRPNLAQEDDADADQEKLLRFRQGEDNTNYLCIPLPEGVKAEQVTLENHYMERQMRIYIEGTAADFYEREAVFGNIDKITAGSFEVYGDTVLLKFDLSDVYECRSIMESGYLYIEFVPPREVYDRIIVLDASGGGQDAGCRTEELSEKDVTLDIIKRLKSLLENSGIKVYYTRTEDVDIPVGDRTALANAVRADMFISVRLSESGDASVYGTETFYNDRYFIPGFGSIELSDIVERAVVTAINGKGNGLFAAPEEDLLLRDATVPAAAVSVGYISNRQEALLLGREDYRERIAKGLYEAILEAYEAMGE